MATLLPSLDSDEEKDIQVDDDSEEETTLDESFEFGGILGEDGGIPHVTEGWSYATALQGYSKETTIPRMDVASLIAAKRKSFSKDDDKKQNDESNNSNSSSSDDDSDDDHAAVDDFSHQDLEEDVLKTRAGNEEQDGGDEESSSDDDDDEEEANKAAAFFDDNNTAQESAIEVFHQLSLSRPLLKGIAAMGFVQPTPIQAAVIPLALAGRDVCASAVTGSGKTAAFLLPILQRILHRQTNYIKAVILTPTRELAAQCLGMMTTLAQFTKLRSSLIVGGAKNVNAQAAELRTRPDIIVATPGRLLDHVLNSAGVTLQDVEFLVLDEADRLLDLGFQDEVHELVRACPIQRQTLLFSATMNTKVDDLVRLSLKRPVRVRISNKEKNGTKDIEVAPRLEQEFVRVRAGNEGINREGMLLALLTRTFTKQTIVFFDTKATAHRLMILCGLCGINCTELHGNLTQQQRLTALEDFRKGHVDVLLATDLAARGLDIDRVKSVINFEMPSTIETYIHRIGRTARAGRGGSSCTLIGEGRRHLMKEVIKDAEKKSKNNDKKRSTDTAAVIRSRVIPPAVVGHFVAKLNSLEPHVEEVLQAEAVARMDRLAEMEAIKAQNIIEHSDEIMAKPQREWFASNKQKQQTKEAAKEKQKMIAEKAGTGMHRMTRKKRRAREAREALAAGPDDDEDEGPTQPAVNIKSDARATKRKQAEKEREAAEKSIQEEFTEEALKDQNKKKKKRKGVDAVGDSSLFDEEKVAFSSKKSKTKPEEKVAKSYYQFKSFDPDKKLGKKKPHHSFKSKSKYKRRK